jgi:DNA (cytosine-5)-methyltransferase 1
MSRNLVPTADAVPPRAPVAISAFTGAGGLDLGLERAGFRIIGCIERDEKARATVLANRPDTVFLQPFDIVDLARTLRPEALGVRRGEVDLLAGAPPCQPFSKAAQWEANSMRGLDDPRSNCLAGFMALVEAFLTAAILIENVPGVAKGKNTSLPLLRRSFAAINSRYGTRYAVVATELNAVNYGVPQRRQRAIILARRDGRPFKWPQETHSENPVRAHDALHGLVVAEVPRATGKWTDLLPSIPEGRNYQWHTPGDGGRPLFGRRTKFWSFLLKLAKAEPAWTLPAQPGPATGPFHWDNRPLTIVEMLRLQSFPADWRVEGGRRAQVLQVGNATPPLLAESIGRSLGEQLFGLTYAHPPTLEIPRIEDPPKPEVLRPVPDKYTRHEGEHAPHPGSGRGPRPRRLAEAESVSTPKPEGSLV